MPVKVRFARIADADTIEPNLRRSDRDELVAASGPDVLGQLREAVELRQGLAALGAQRVGLVEDGGNAVLFLYRRCGNC